MKTKTLIALSLFLVLTNTACKKKTTVETPAVVPVNTGAVFVDDKTGLIRLKQGTTILFATGSDQLLDESKPTLDDVATVLSQNSVMKIRVEGHTDSDGDDNKNLELSTKRAASVKTYLEGKGIAGDRIESVGCGETAPLADNATDEGKQQNRRVVFVIGRGTRTAKPCKVYKPAE
jgi:outer membrane protein OmpA-like peptidoglycan-associated protein